MNDIRGLLCTVFTKRMQQAREKYEVCQVAGTVAMFGCV